MAARIRRLVARDLRRRCFRLVAACVALCANEFAAFAQTRTYTHFEARQTHSIALTPDGTRLLALNSPGASLTVFEIATAQATPVRIAEIPVGLEPVSVAAWTNDEVWVVNEVSDSISIVSLSRKAVVATLSASDEPADIVFAQGKAFVSCARNGIIRVFDAVTKAALAPISLAGLDPRSLAIDAAGSRVFAAFLHSGNGTTILPRSDAPAQPAPADPNLPNPPNTALIVAADDIRVAHKVLDRDVAVIDASSGQVLNYHGGVGTNLFALSIHPITGQIWVANTEARNLIRFEPNLRGHFVDNRLTGVSPSTGATTIIDLNRGVDYGTLPNASAQSESLAQPTGLVFAQDGRAWVAAFGSDLVARIDTATGDVLARIDIRTGGGNSSRMRGSRSLALNPTGGTLYVLNKLADTVSVINTGTNSVLAEVPVSGADTMPPNIRAGRGFLFDARLSGNGTASCASCHIDADRDGLAWDLGDPAGEMVTVPGANLSVHDTVLRPRVMHPMKGPMVTQTLRGMQKGAPFHWRGDRPALQSFNRTFDRLGGGVELAPDDLDHMAEYLLSLRNHPNPNRPRSGALPATFAGGNPSRGEILFNQHDNHCGICHLPPKGSDNNIDLPQEVGASQPIKNPPLGTVYQRTFFDPRPGAQSLSGFGLLHDGAGSGLSLPTVHPYVLDQLATSADFLDVQAFVLCFDTGTSPGVGESLTVTEANRPSANDGLTRLELSSSDSVQLVVFATIGGEKRRFIYSRALQVYIPEDLADLTLTRQALLALLEPNDSMTFLGTQPLEGSRFAGTLARAATALPDSYFLQSSKQSISIPVAQGVLANDVQVAPTHDAAAMVLPPNSGEAILGADGSFTYTPAPTFTAATLDSFEYRVLVAGDAGNTTANAAATISTIASASGQYSGYIVADADHQPSGFITVSISENGNWTASARIGAKSLALKGIVLMDGTLQPKRTPALDIGLRLSALPNGDRRISAKVSGNGATATGMMPRSAYSKASPAPNSGKHQLTLTVASTTGVGPTESGRATLKLKPTGTVTLVGKLGDNASFTCSGVVSPREGGGWRFMCYASIYKSPPGSVSGDLEFDPGSSSGIAGTLTAIKPPQMRPGPFQDGFRIEYAATEGVQL